MAGIALYTYHKYQKSIATPLPQSEETHHYSSLDPPTGVPLENFDSPTPTYPPQSRETPEERTQRLRDEFEGWERASSTWSDGDEVEEDEVERRMSEREGGKGVTPAVRGKWGEWWGKEM